MSDALDTVADAFSVSMGGAPARQERNDSSVKAEPVFDNNMEFEPEGENDEPEVVDQPRRTPKEPKQDVDPFDETGPIGDDEEGEEGQEEEGEEEGVDGKVASLDPEAIVEVKVDGEVLKVPLKEALEGYSRTKAFHQRVNALNQEKESVQQVHVAAKQKIDEYGRKLVEISAELDSIQPKEPDWDQLFAADPTKAVQQKIAWDRYKGERAALEAEKQRVATERAAIQQKDLGNHIAVEGKKLLEAFPHWSDPKARERDTAAIKKTAMAAGFTDDELATVYDSRMVKILMKAARYDRLASKKLVPNKSTTKTMKSGSASNVGTGQRGFSRAMREHSRQGTVDSAADVFAEVLSREG